MSDLESLKNIIRRERQARKNAELIIEEKSRELFTLNQELQEMNDSLEVKIKERTHELEEAMEAAEASSRAKSEFLSNMSHEIRTPLNAIVGLTEILRMQELPDKGAELVQNVKHSADTLMSLINDILDFSAIESGKISFEEVNFDFPYICRRLKETFRHQASEKGLKFVLTIDDEIPQHLIGDPTKLNQVLINLIGNALKFTEVGKIRMDAELIEKTEDTVRIQIEVTDSGVGIPEDRVDSIFQKFEQAESSTKRKFGGTGLGLAITKELIELQDGKIWVESTYGKGSTFGFELGYKIGQGTTITDASGEVIETGTDISGLRVLLAEDIEMNQYLMKQIFSQWNLVPDIAENGLVVLEKMANAEYDVLLLDMHMPEMDGIETATHIRAGKVKQKDIHIVGLTADVFTETRDALLKAGVTSFLTKPINIPQLYEKLKEINA
ncbi:ATP-binding protein [Sanyastnella coralliicola]|uniref:ATP-binding protein n=1 Tax=Sanyastnella coralliicola TaxID=3069118 RepID=UPI0027BA5C9A|nr:ATP-binding protein [Longitalea sp. SCSIO 12813]